MKKGLFAMMAAGLIASGAPAAQIDLQNASDGSAKLTIFQEGTINVVVITAAIDSTQISFVNAFFDTNNDNVDVVSATGGQTGWTYDRSSFNLPAEIDEAGENEYALVAGDSDGSSALPISSGTFIIDVLGVATNEVTGSTLVTFELGARQPQVFGPPPGFTPFTVAPINFPGNVPNFIYVGDASSNNSAFHINYIPEPACLGLVTLGGLAGIRRRR